MRATGADIIGDAPGAQRRCQVLYIAMSTRENRSSEQAERSYGAGDQTSMASPAALDERGDAVGARVGRAGLHELDDVGAEAEGEDDDAVLW